MRKVGLVLTLAAFAATAALAADAAAGKAVYDKSCKSCHGPEGVANPAIAKMMKVEMKDLKSAEVQALSEADVKKIVAEGKGKMKPIKTVTPKEAGDVVAFLHTLKK
jgi:mono/diheme cytochrome c family protein